MTLLAYSVARKTGICSKTRARSCSSLFHGFANSSCLGINQTWHPQFHTRDKVHLCAHLRMTKPLPSTLNNTKRQTHYLVSQSKGVALKTEKPERKKAMNIMKQKLKSKHS